MSYLIGEAARRVGVSPSALRLWERQGLVRPSRQGRYRLYEEADVEHLRAIRRMRQVDRLNAPGIRRVLLGPRGTTHVERRFDGSPLRRRRQSEKLSLRMAADRTGLSVSFLSALERGMTGASVATLQRLAAAYGTTMVELFGTPSPDQGQRLVRAGEATTLRLGTRDIRIHHLAKSATQLEPQLFVLAEGATSDGAYAHEGEEFLYLLAGCLTVWLGEGETYRMRTPGDALTFPSIIPHRWRNDARGETRLLWINTPPTF